MSENVKKFVDSLYDQTPEGKILDLYVKWADTYDRDLTENEDGYQGFKIIAKVVDLFSENTSAEILDVAAGTGLVAVQLRKLNYLNIDGMDPCKEMLDKAKEKNLYRNYFYQFATDQPDPLHEKYDQVAIGGGFSRGHMNYSDIAKLIKYAKINGYISFDFRYEALESYQVEVPSEVDRLEKEGIVEVIIKAKVPKYYTTIPGFLILLKRLK